MHLAGARAAIAAPARFEIMAHSFAWPGGRPMIEEAGSHFFTINCFNSAKQGHGLVASITRSETANIPVNGDWVRRHMRLP